MSKVNNEDQKPEEPADLAPENGKPDEKLDNPAGENYTADNPPQNKEGEGDELLSIEEHQKNLDIGAPVFAAVMQSNRWGAGKKVSKADFQNAVKAFLGAPMGGKK
jgi:hypothetical protein